jgi:hypothetical protein
MNPMKPALLTALASLAMLPALSAQDAAPTPAPPVSAPVPGMAWEIDIRPAPRAGAAAPENPEAAAAPSPAPTPPPALRLTGRCGPDGSAWTLRFPGGATRDFFLTGNRLFSWIEKTAKLSRPALRDGEHDEAAAFEVSRFPGIGWVTPDKKPVIGQDAKTRAWQAIYTQEASPFDIVNPGTEEEYAVPTGPSVRVVAIFDALTGLPVKASVGDKIYHYRIDPKAGRAPSLSPAFRQALDARLQREAALKAAIAREEKIRR